MLDSKLRWSQSPVVTCHLFFMHYLGSWHVAQVVQVSSFHCFGLSSVLSPSVCELSSWFPEMHGNVPCTWEDTGPEHLMWVWVTRRQWKVSTEIPIIVLSEKCEAGKRGARMGLGERKLQRKNNRERGKKNKGKEDWSNKNSSSFSLHLLPKALW